MGAWRPKHVEWLCRNKTCTVLHQVGVLFDLYYDARNHKIKTRGIALSMTMPDHCLQELSWEATAVPVGSSSISSLQSRLVPLRLSCVWGNGKGTQMSAVCYQRRYTGSNHIMTSLTATGLLQTWYRWTRETVGCICEQPWGLCRIFWSVCCVICSHLFISYNPSTCLSTVESSQPVFFNYSDMWYIHMYMRMYIHTHTHMHAYIHTYIHACVHTYIHKFIHT